MKEVAIIILTHNAPEFVKETLETLNNITDAEDLSKCEIIVYDNASEPETIKILKNLTSRGFIDKIFFSDKNLLFAGGNNAAIEMASSDIKYYLLLNSDIKINDPKWLRILLNVKKEDCYNVVSYGTCTNPTRADGYCFLVDKHLYDKYKLDESYQWWWSVTKLQANILKSGGKILAFKNHETLIHHYGGASGKDFKDAKGMNIDITEVKSWFESNKNEVIVRRASVLNGMISMVNKYRK